MRKLSLAIVLLTGCLFWAAPRGFAQASKLDDGPPPPPPEEPAPPPEPPKPQFDPLRAHKDLEVGSYYLRTENYNAAIDRFEEAATLQPGLAEPFRLLGRTYEKKHEPQKAVDAYNRYLKAFPNAPDHAEIQKQIERLTEEIQRQAKR